MRDFVDAQRQTLATYLEVRGEALEPTRAAWPCSRGHCTAYHQSNGISLTHDLPRGELRLKVLALGGDALGSHTCPPCPPFLQCSACWMYPPALPPQVLARKGDASALDAISQALAASAPDHGDQLADLQALATALHSTTILWQLHQHTVASGAPPLLEHGWAPQLALQQHTPAAEPVPTPSPLSTQSGVLEQGWALYAAYVIDAHLPDGSPSPGACTGSGAAGPPPIGRCQVLGREAALSLAFLRDRAAACRSQAPLGLAMAEEGGLQKMMVIANEGELRGYAKMHLQVWYWGACQTRV